MEKESVEDLKIEAQARKKKGNKKRSHWEDPDL